MRKLYVVLLLLAAPCWLAAQGTPLDKTAWSVTFVSSEMSATSSDPAPATNAIDGNTATFWHTEWTPNHPPPPHSVEIDMGSPERIYCFGFLPRAGDNGRPKNCVISVKLNPGDAWTVVATVITGYNDNQQNFFFDAVDAQYLKLEILDCWSAKAHVGINEIYAFSAPVADFIANRTQIFRGEAIKFKGFSAYTNPALDWTFNGGTPSTANTVEADIVYNSYGSFDVTLNATDGVTPGTITKPNFIKVTDTLIQRYAWTCAGTSTDVTAGYEVEKVFDNNANSYFITPIVAPFPAFPHYFTVDMGKVYPVTAFGYTPRASGTGGLIKGWEYWVSSDNVSFTKVKSGTWPADNTVKVELLVAQVDAQYFKLVILSNYETDVADTRAQIAELNAYGPVKVVDFTNETTVMTVNFHPTANGNPTGYSWTFQNGVPATSSDMHPTTTFTVAGYNSVTCVANYAGGETASVTKKVVVKPFQIPTNSWSVVEVHDEEPAETPNGYAKNLFDNDLNTFWHTQWDKQYTPFPHWITVDMGSPLKLSAITFDQRKSNNPGAPKDVILYTSTDGITFDEAARATWANDATQKNLFFNTVEVQFFKFFIEMGYSTANNKPFSAGAELKAYGQNVVVYWNNPADIELGTALSETQLNASSNFPGTYVYTPALGTILSIGTHDLTVDFTPTDVTLSPITTVVKINVIPTIIVKSGWTVHFVDSEEKVGEGLDGFAARAIDGDLATYWHTQWDPISPAYPHQLSINMGAVYKLEALTLELRSGNGRIKDYEIWTSLTGGMNLSDSTIIPSEWQMAVSGTFAGTVGGPNNIAFPAPVDAKYFRILALSEINNKPFACIKEVTAYGVLHTDGISQKSNSAISVYPNPAKEILNITNLSDVSKGKNVAISITDLNGRTVLTSKFTDNSNSTTVNISMLPKGIYVLKLQTENGMKFTKFVKQ